MVNREIINDRFKLAYHRLVAHQLKHDPELLELARAIVVAWKAYPINPTYVDEWESILKQPVDQTRQIIVNRSETLTRLRISSPLGLLGYMIMCDEDRMRLW